MEYNKTITLLKSLLLVLGVTALVASCEKEQSLTEPAGSQDISYYLENDVESPEDFPAFTDLNEAEVEMILDLVQEEMDAAEFEDGKLETRAFFRNRDILLFKAAIILSGLAPEVIRKEVTAFAPKNSVFLGLGIRNLADLFTMNRDLLRSILRAHIIYGRVFAADIEPGFVMTKNGSFIKLDLDGGVKVTDGMGETSMVVRADIFDILFYNGVVHKIDGLLAPPSMNITEIAIAASEADEPQFTALVAAVVKAGLADVLANDGPFTVFAPVDAAFTALLESLIRLDILPPGATLDDVPVDLLQQILLTHVLDGYVFSTDVVGLAGMAPPPQTVITKSGAKLFIQADLTISDEEMVIMDDIPGPANLVATDIQATNGVIHVIDRVLLP